MSNKTLLNESKIRIWDQEMTLTQAFAALADSPTARNLVLAELGKRILIEKSFAEYQINLRGDENLKGSLKQKLIDSLKLKDENGFQRFLQIVKRSEEEVLDELIYQEQIKKLKSILITPEAIRDLFLKNKPKSDAVVFAAIRVKDKALAQELYFQIKDDKQDFAELAQKYSVGEEAKQGGIIGPQPLSSLNPEIRKRLQTLAPGEITEPFSLDSASEIFLIIRLIKLQSTQLTPELANNLKDQLFETWLSRQLNLSGVSLNDG